MAVDLLPKRDTLEIIVPQNATSIGLTYHTVAWTWPAWTQVHAGLAFPFVLCGMYVNYMQAAAATAFPITQVQIGTGAALSEVAIATSGSSCLFVNSTGTTVYAMYSETAFFGPLLIPASTRIAARQTGSVANVPRCRLYLFGYDARYWPPVLEHQTPERYMRGLSIKTSECYPSGNVTSITAGNPAWTFGAWTEFIAAATNPTLITGIAMVAANIVSNNPCQMQIGLGANPNEVAHSQVGFPSEATVITTATAGGISYLPRPLYVKAGERVCVRAESSVLSKVYEIFLLGHELK